MNAICAAVLLVAIAFAEAQQPNFVFILADDLGWNDVGWHNPEILTPNLEALRVAGIELDNNYVQSVCTPSRHALMSGKYPFKSGMQSGVVFPDRAECAPVDQKFAPQYLKELGYDTHMIGKWHLGFCDVKCTPTYKGFDTFLGFYNGYIDHYSHMHGETGTSGYDFHNGTSPSIDTAGVHGNEIIRKRAVEVISNHSPDYNNPMYLYVAFGDVHAPLQAPEKFYNMYPEETNEDRRLIKAMVSHTDDVVGSIVTALSDAGIIDNTIIFFISDNGGESPVGSNLPLRGAKGSYFEGGIKSAGLVYSPLLQSSGYKADQMIHVMDWTPTLVALADGIPDASLDGVDQSDFIMNGGPSARDEFVINIDDRFPQSLGKEAIRSGQYKMIRGYPGMVDGYGDNVMPAYINCGGDLTGGNFKRKRHLESLTKRGSYAMTAEQTAALNNCITTQSDTVRLYDLLADPNETTNVADQYPDVVAALAAKLDEYTLSLVPAPEENFITVPESNPMNFGGVWSSGWCTK